MNKMFSQKVNGLKILNKYSNALNLLDDYDYKVIDKSKVKVNNNKITYDECIDIINKLKYNNNSNILVVLTFLIAEYNFKKYIQL